MLKKSKNMSDRYKSHNRRKYMLQVHLIFVTKYRKGILHSGFAEDVKQYLFEAATGIHCDILAMETDKDHVHILLGYDTTKPVCDIVKRLKQYSTYMAWQKHTSLLSKQYWKKNILWSDGYFACSIGEVSQAVIEQYIKNQG